MRGDPRERQDPFLKAPLRVITLFNGAAPRREICRRLICAAALKRENIFSASFIYRAGVIYRSLHPGKEREIAETLPRFHALRLNSFLSYLFASVLLLTLPVSNSYLDCGKKISHVYITSTITLNNYS